MTKVAIIDDHEAMREGLEVLLRDGGMDVVGTAGNVAAGLDLVEHLDPDIALVDVRLPDGSGIDLTRDLLARRPELGVVLYTGDTDADLLLGGLDSGARGYVLKAGSLRELVGAIERVAGGGTYVDPRLDPLLGLDQVHARGQRLSPREREVMRLTAEGLTAEEIGEELGVSVETVRTHVRNAIRKLRARNRVHATALALDRGEITLSPNSSLDATDVAERWAP